MSCTAYVLGEHTNGFTIGTKYSCSTPGGCTSSANTYLGSNYLEWTSTASNPSTSEILCNIPNIPSGLSVSAIHSLSAHLTVQ